MDKKRLKIAKEVFVMKENAGYLVYSPLTQIVGLVDKGTLQHLKSFSDNPSAIMPEQIDKLKSIGFLVEEEQIPFEEYKLFSPTSLTLFPTSDCNLSCVYCYGDAGREKKSMNITIAKAGIDLIIENALKKSTEKVYLSYHGGGEPTYNWGFLTDSVNYFKKQCNNKGLKQHITLATNGILNTKQIEWIINNIEHTQLSFDGPEDIQDKQRPYRSGSGSFKEVYKTAKAFTKENYNFGIRTTVTDVSVSRIEEIYNFFISELNPSYIHLEPLFECGRCKTSKWKAPSLEEYQKNILNLLEKISKKTDNRLITSSGNIGRIRSYFCGAAGGRTFSITPEGFVSGCSEISLISDPRSDIFFYGSFDKSTNRFVIDEEKRQYLNGRQTKNLEHCSDCFIKWNCAGDCLSKIGEDIYDTRNNPRCELNRTMAKYSLIRKINGGK